MKVAGSAVDSNGPAQEKKVNKHHLRTNRNTITSLYDPCSKGGAA